MGFKEWFLGTNENLEVREGTIEPTASQVSPSVGIQPPLYAEHINSTCTVDEALKIGAAFRAVTLLQTMVGQLELAVYRSGKEVKPSDRTFPALIKNPNINDTRSAFVEETVFSLAAYGNGYWLLRGVNATGIPSSLEVLSPKKVRPFIDEKGKKKFSYSGTDYTTKEIKHLKLFREPGELLGLGPIQQAAEVFRAAIALQAFQAQWFDTSGVPLGLLKTDQQLGDGEGEIHSEAWKSFVSRHMTPVLGRGLDYVLLSGKPAELQMLEVQQELIKSIARVFGIPAMNLLAELTGSNMTYTNLETSNVMFIQNTLSRYMNEIENALTDLIPRGQEVRFNEESLLRMDTQTKWNVIKTQTEVGYTNGDELRREEGKRPLPKPAADPESTGDTDE